MPKTSKRKYKQEKQEEHKSFNNSELKKILLLIVGLLAAGGYLLRHQQEDVLDHPTYPMCDNDGDILECIRQVCNSVSAEIIPLNRPANSYFYVKDKHISFFNGSKSVDDPNELLVAELDVMPRGPDFNDILAKFKNYRLTSEQRDFLFDLAYLISYAHVPNCGGMSAQVALRLITQPIIQKTNMAVKVRSLLSIGTYLPHVITEVDDGTHPSIVCDAWEKRDAQATVCVMDPKNFKNECSSYQPGLWYIDSTKSAKLKMPNLSTLPAKARSQYRHEVRELLSQLNQKTREAQQAYEKFIKSSRQKTFL